MIKFFRKIRQQMLSENKFSKYLLYAIGEIILVVIGILIALQINNKNQHGKDKVEELKILKSLEKEVASNIKVFNDDYTIQQRNFAAIQKIAVIRPSLLPLGHLDSLIQKTRPHTYNASFGILNSVTNAGKIELITNDSLKEKISQLKDYIVDYREDQDNVLDMTMYISKIWIEDDFYINNEVIAGLRVRTEQEKVKDKEQYIRFYNSPKVKKAFLHLTGLTSGVLIEGGQLNERLNNLHEAIKNEIQLLEND